MVVKGIIKPPPDIRAVVDRTAKFVSKNGRAFEQRILNSEKGKTPKFAFLHDSSPFHAYYEARISFHDEGGTDDKEKKGDTEEDGTEEEKKSQKANDANEAIEKEKTKKEEELPAKQDLKRDATTTSVQKANIDPIARSMIEARADINQQVKHWEGQQKLEQEARDQKENEDTQQSPPPSGQAPVKGPAKHQLIHMTPPHSITAAQLDIVRLAAQFTAMSKVIPSSSGGVVGSMNPFLDTLRLKEWNNYEVFGFLQPRHAHYAYFTALVDGYKSLLQMFSKAPPTGENKAKSTRSGGSVDEVEEELVRCAVPFSRDGGGMQACLNVAAYRVEYQRYQYEQQRAQAADDDEGGGRLAGGAAYVDWHDFVVVETIDFSVDEVVSAIPPPPPAALSAAAAAAVSATSNSSTTVKDHVAVTEETMDISDDEEIKIVDSYQPRVKATAAQQQMGHAQTMIDPITGKAILVSDLSEHMRIQLLDPTWAEEKKRFQEKQRDSNLLQGEDVARNLQRFAKQQRGDETDMLDDATMKGRDGQIAKRPRLEAETGSDPTTFARPLPPPPPPPPTMNPAPLQPQVPPPVHSAAPVRAEMPEPRRAPLNLPPLLNPPEDNVVAGTEQSPVDVPVEPPASVTFTILAPDAGESCGHKDQFQQWGLRGQSLTLDELPSDGTTVKSLKEMVRSRLTEGKMPLNKMQLRLVSSGAFLKDVVVLSNIEGIRSVEDLELVPKVRGGKK
jgi:splicing factor 3A subunit 1